MSPSAVATACARFHARKPSKTSRSSSAGFGTAGVEKVPLTRSLYFSYPPTVTDEELRTLATRLTGITGVDAVLLGGSRARGEHAPDSDFDLGLYYRPPLDVEGLRLLAREVAGRDATVTEPGGWGPWVDGGGWFTIGGASVDWIYRDIDRVRQSWEDTQAGRFTFNAQTGHPLGVPDFAYAGEVALGVVLADATGEVTELQGHARHYPAALAEAVIDKLWEASFLLELAAKGVGRRDAAYVAGCLFRVVGLCAHAIHARAGRWLLNEKGCVAAAANLAIAPEAFGDRAHRLLGNIGTDAGSIAAVIDAARLLVDETRAVCGRAEGAESTIRRAHR